MERFRLSIRDGEEGHIPRGHLAVDIHYFDYASLVKLYGGEKVDKYLEREGLEADREGFIHLKQAVSTHNDK